MQADNGNLSESSLAGLLECLLFVATEPLTPRQAAELLQVDEPSAYAELEAMRHEFAGRRGLQVARIAGGYQLRTHPAHGELITRFLQPDAQRLSRQAVETVAVIAYRQPITQAEIDALRGVCSSGVLKTLLDRGLIREAGRKEAPGRPILYATTPEFLKHFALSDLADLPELEETAGASMEASGLRAA